MNVFIVHVHPEPKNFNGALTNVAQEAPREAVHAVKAPDLYAMKFAPYRIVATSRRPRTPTTSSSRSKRRTRTRWAASRRVSRPS